MGPPDSLAALDPELLQGYEILEALGEGSFSTVYRARQRSLEREVVLKVVRLGPEVGAEERERYRREAAMLARLDHPQVVPLLDHGVSGSALFLAYPDTGARSLDDPAVAGDWQGPAAVERLLREVLEGLEYLHAEGVIHRDLKPANLLVLPDGHLQLVDFGLSKDLERTALTHSGVFLGTASFAAPQQLAGEAADPRDDLYSLGVIAYERLAGENPFARGTLPATAVWHREHVPAPAAEVAPDAPPRVAALVDALLRKRRGDRPPSAAAARRWLREGPPADPAVVRGEAGTRAPRRAWALGLLLVLAGGAWVLSAVGSAHPPPPASPPAAAPSPAADPTVAPDLPPGVEDRIRGELERSRSWVWAEGDRVLEGGRGPPFLDPDPARRAEVLRALPALRELLGWFRRGGLPHRVPEARLRDLEDADRVLEAAGLGRVVTPWLRVHPVEAARPVPASLRELSARRRLEPLLPEALEGWSGAVLREYAEILPVLERRAEEFRTRDGSPDEPALFRHVIFEFAGDLAEEVSGRKVDVFELPAELFASRAGRVAYDQWMVEPTERFLGLMTCAGIALREEPEEASRVALWLVGALREIRMVLRGTPALLGAGLASADTLAGPRGALLRAAVLHQGDRVLDELPGGKPARRARIRALLDEAGEVPGEGPVPAGWRALRARLAASNP